LLVGAINQTRQLTIKGRKFQRLRKNWETVHHHKVYELLCAISVASLKTSSNCIYSAVSVTVSLQFEQYLTAATKERESLKTEYVSFSW